MHSVAHCYNLVTEKQNLRVMKSVADITLSTTTKKGDSKDTDLTQHRFIFTYRGSDLKEARSRSCWGRGTFDEISLNNRCIELSTYSSNVYVDMNFNSLTVSHRSSDHCLATFLRFLDDSKKLRNSIKSNFYALTYSS